jgi:hypothetical protein
MVLRRTYCSPIPGLKDGGLSSAAIVARKVKGEMAMAFVGEKSSSGVDVGGL